MKPHRPNYSERAEPFDVPVKGLRPADDEQLAWVPYVPVRCPFCTTPHKPRMCGGRYGRKGKHKCVACGRYFLSILMPPACVTDWPPPSSEMHDEAE